MYVCMYTPRTFDLSLLRNWQFHSIAVALVLLVRFTNKLAKVLEHVFRSKKNIKTVFGNSVRKTPNFQHNEENKTFF